MVPPHLRTPNGTIVAPWRHHRGTVAAPSWHRGGAIVAPSALWWHRRGTIVAPCDTITPPYGTLIWRAPPGCNVAAGIPVARTAPAAHNDTVRQEPPGRVGAAGRAIRGSRAMASIRPTRPFSFAAALFGLLFLAPPARPQLPEMQPGKPAAAPEPPAVSQA